MDEPVIHICNPRAILFRRYRVCPVCKLRARWLVEDFTWWGAQQTCLNCGAQFYDGRRRQTWEQRIEARDRGRILWQQAPPRREAERQLREAT